MTISDVKEVNQDGTTPSVSGVSPSISTQSDTLALCAILEALPEPVCILSKERIVQAANRPFLDLLRWDDVDLAGCSAEIFWSDCVAGAFGPGEHSTEFRTTDGAAVSVKLSVSLSSALMVVRVLASFSHNDVAKVFHNQRLETLGILAGGVAHDFNNILTGMLGHLAYLRSVLPSNGNHVESLASIEEGAVRAASMTQQIVGFSRLAPTESSKKIEVSDLIARLCPLMRGAIPPEIQLKWSPPVRPVFVLGTEAHLCQVLINLVVNARDAIDGGGEIEVQVVPESAPQDIEAIFGAEPPAAAYGELLVRDTGSGMSEETKRRLFEPYFTTKDKPTGARSGGSGLGLATVQSIVRALGGAIIVESEPGSGSTFRVVLPVVEERSAVNLSSTRQQNSESGEPPSEVDADDQPIRGHGERILVIDDEYAVRNVLGLSLTHLGYTLETAASGLEGLEKFAEADGNFDLIILDLLMPGLSGEEVFGRLKRLNGDVKVLLVSGFSSETVVRRLLDGGGTGFIQKPFSIEILADRVHRCLHE